MNRFLVIIVIIGYFVISRQIIDDDIQCLGLNEDCGDTFGVFKDDDIESPLIPFPSDDFTDDIEEAVVA